jgi:hypothetical protein
MVGTGAVKPDYDGSFESSVFVGREGTKDVGQSYKIRLCAVAKDSFAWYESLLALPRVRIESNTVNVKRTA